MGLISFIQQQKTGRIGRQVTNRRQHLSTGFFHLQFGCWMPFSLPPPFCNSLTFALISSAALQFFRHSCYFFLPSSFSGFSRLGLHAFSFPGLLFFTICSSSFFFLSLCHLFFPNLCREESFYCTVPITPIKREVEELNTIDEVSRVVRLEVQEHFCIILLRSARIPPHMLEARISMR